MNLEDSVIGAFRNFKDGVFCAYWGGKHYVEMPEKATEDLESFQEGDIVAVYHKGSDCWYCGLVLSGISVCEGLVVRIIDSSWQGGREIFRLGVKNEKKISERIRKLSAIDLSPKGYWRIFGQMKPKNCED